MAAYLATMSRACLREQAIRQRVQPWMAACLAEITQHCTWSCTDCNRPHRTLVAKWQQRYLAALPGKLHHDRGRLQVSLPIATVDGCPLGLGLMGPRGSDEDLLQLAGDILALLRRPSADVGGAAAGR